MNDGWCAAVADLFTVQQGVPQVFVIAHFKTGLKNDDSSLPLCHRLILFMLNVAAWIHNCVQHDWCNVRLAGLNAIRVVQR